MSTIKRNQKNYKQGNKFLSKIKKSFPSFSSLLQLVLNHPETLIKVAKENKEIQMIYAENFLYITILGLSEIPNNIYLDMNDDPGF